MSWIAVVDCPNSQSTPDSIEIFPNTMEGIKRARECFIDMVSEDLREAYDNESEQEIRDRAQGYLDASGESKYEVGDGYIAYMSHGVTVEK